MSDPVWQYFNPENTIVWRRWPNGRQDSCSVQATEFLAWIAEGNAPNPYVPPPAPPEPTIDEKLASVGLTLDDLKTALGIK
jgi:hypothetical protein